MKTHQKYIFSLVAALVLAGCRTNMCEVAGIYSNRMDGFNSSSVILAPNGEGLFFSSIGGVFGSWTILCRDENQYVHLRWADGGTTDVQEGDALFRLDKTAKTLDFVGIGDNFDETLTLARTQLVSDSLNREKHYTYLTNEIHKAYEAILAVSSAYLVKRKIGADYQRHQKEVREALARQEDAQCEARLAEIKANPRKILTIPFTFYRKGESSWFIEGRTKLTPDVRAVMVALADKSITFSEETLLAFLNRYDWKSCFYVIAPVFVRDELTGEARRKLHPRMRDYAERLDGRAAQAFYLHPNTPLDLVEDACHWNVMGEFKRELEGRLARERKPENAQRK